MLRREEGAGGPSRPILAFLKKAEGRQSSPLPDGFLSGPLPSRGELVYSRETVSVSSQAGKRTKAGNPPVVLAVGAHPDDIEFMMAGTLLRLGEQGARLHMWNVANGCCGTTKLPPQEIARIRWEEASRSAALAGATLHPPIADDGFIFYDRPLLMQAAALVRRVQPTILLLPSPQDYMEDHQNVSRLLTTAAFVRSMRNFPTQPPLPPMEKDVVIYHALPYGLRDGLRRRVRPGLYVDISPVWELKRRMLACHRSQGEWLEASQGMSRYLQQMEEMDREVGRWSGAFQYAEGWRRRLHLGFSRRPIDPLQDLLREGCRVDADYERGLEA